MVAGDANVCCLSYTYVNRTEVRSPQIGRKPDPPKSNASPIPPRSGASPIPQNRTQARSPKNRAQVRSPRTLNAQIRPPLNSALRCPKKRLQFLFVQVPVRPHPAAEVEAKRLHLFDSCAYIICIQPARQKYGHF